MCRQTALYIQAKRRSMHVSHSLMIHSISPFAAGKGQQAKAASTQIVPEGK